MNGKTTNENLSVGPIERVDKHGRRWIQDHEATYDRVIEQYDAEETSINKRLILRYLTEIRTGDRSKKGARRVVSKSRCLRILGILRLVDGWLDHKPFLDVTEDEMRRLMGRLADDIITSPTTKMDYKETTKATIRKVVKKFWKHIKGQDKFYPPEVDFIDTYEPTIEGEYYKFEDIELLRDSCQSWTMKTLVWFLFDSGVRENEALNLRVGDIIPPTPTENYYVVNVRDAIAKDARGRKIGLFLSNAYLKNYLDQHHPDRDPNSFLFPYREATLRCMLYRKGMRVLRKSITPHRIRRSSAIYYGVRIKSFQTYCARFGWSLHSRTADKYFRAKGMSTREAMQDIVTFEREQLQNRYRTEMITNHEVLDENFALKEQIRQLEGHLVSREDGDALLNRLFEQPEVQTIVKKLAREQVNARVSQFELLRAEHPRE